MLTTVFSVFLYVTIAFAATINSEDICSDYQLECSENDTCMTLNSICMSVNREPGEECTIWTSEVRWLRCPKGICDSSVSHLCEDITTCDTLQPKLMNVNDTNVTNDTMFKSCLSPGPIPNMIMTPSLPSGKHYDYLFFEYKCLPEYVMVGDKYQFCSNGKWCGRTPKCVRDAGEGSSKGGADSAPLEYKCRANEWTCNDGSCVNETNKCDGYNDCPDGSDEWDCPINASCILPPYPDHGIYVRRVDANTTVPASPREKYDTVLLHINCDDGYDATIKDLICNNGTWLHEMPKCESDAGVGSRMGGTDTAPVQYVCKANEWTCNDGSCVNETNKCDGYNDCPDGSDEWDCPINSSCTLPPYPDHGIYLRQIDANTTVPASPHEIYDTVRLHINCDNGYEATIKDIIICINGTWINEMPKCENLDVINRLPHNSANWCSSTQWRCNDGDCIDNKEKCDGKNDCYDRSDELYCTVEDKSGYSNCVVPDHPPNGMYMFSPPYEPGREVVSVNVSVVCDDDFRADKEFVSCSAGEWSGKNPECIQLLSTPNCSEGQWQCINGECIYMTSKCDGLYDCIDHSDETEELCSKNDANLNESSCSVPLINNGQYTIRDLKIQPGEGLAPKVLNVTCDAGHMLQGMPLTLCLNGTWKSPIPKCIRYCKLKQLPSMQYHCKDMENEMAEYKPCRDKEPVGTVIKLSCSTYYFAEETPPKIKCTEFGWTQGQGQTCKPECGTLTPHVEALSINGQFANRSDVPWHAGIYEKKKKKNEINETNEYEQICGGTLISYSILLSAAHCFHGNEIIVKIRKPQRYSVGIGKIYRAWDDKSEYADDVQKSHVKRIIIPEGYHSDSTYYQSDIAVIVVTKPFEHRAHIVPVCLDLDPDFDERQINRGGFGKVAGWGHTTEYGESSPVLKILDEPIFNHSQCFEKVPIQSRPLITSDKICGGYTNGTQALCKGDSGGGLSMPDIRQGIQRYYLRGIVSTSTASPSNGKICNKNSLTYFTRVVYHKDFISNILNDEREVP